MKKFKKIFSWIMYLVEPELPGSRGGGHEKHPVLGRLKVGICIAAALILVKGLSLLIV